MIVYERYCQFNQVITMMLIKVKFFAEWGCGAEKVLDGKLDGLAKDKPSNLLL